VLPAIEVRGVSKAYGSLQALSSIDLEISQGEFFALLGPNGAGKTTTLLMLLGLAIVWSSLVTLLCLVIVYIVLRYLFIKREEIILEEEFGDEYQSFKTRARRWI